MSEDARKWLEWNDARRYRLGENEPAKHIRRLLAENARLREGIAYYLKHSHLFSLGKEYDKDAPAKLEALIAGGE